MSSAGLMIIGASGMAGRALMAEAGARNMPVSGVSRSGPHFAVDIRDAEALRALVLREAPKIIINCAADISVESCDTNPGNAYLTNARPSVVLSEAAANLDARYVYISTDHYFSGDGRKLHDEFHPIKLINEYARTKYLGEVLTLRNSNALVARTNIVGLAADGRYSFGDWALKLIREDGVATLFDDQFTSPIDIWSFSSFVLDAAASNYAGVLNIAGSTVSSRAEFIAELASKLGRSLTRAKVGHMPGAGTATRPNSMGLDVRRLEALVGRRAPSLSAVTQAIADRSNL